MQCFPRRAASSIPRPACVSLRWRSFYGREWVTQAALLKTAHRAVFAPSSATGPQLFESARMKTQTFCKQKTASVSLRWRSFYGRGWIARAAHLKKPRRGFFAAGTDGGGRCCSNPPACVSLLFVQKKNARVFLHKRSLGGRGWIRTTEAEKQQIYSLSPLATREHAHILFTVHAGLPVYLTTAPGICQVFCRKLFCRNAGSLFPKEKHPNPQRIQVS